MLMFIKLSDVDLKNIRRESGEVMLNALGRRLTY